MNEYPVLILHGPITAGTVHKLSEQKVMLLSSINLDKGATLAVPLPSLHDGTSRNEVTYHQSRSNQ